MREKTELITLRIPRSLYSVILAISKSGNLYFSDVIRTAVQFGLSSKGAKEELAKKIDLYRKESAFADGDQEIKIAMKEAYSVSNFKQLVNQLWSNSEISRLKKIQVINSLFDRIEKTEGKDSESYCEVQKWLMSNYPQLAVRLRESVSRVKGKADTITE